MAEVADIAFIQELKQRPDLSLKQDAQGIPLIDLSCPDKDALVHDIGHACTKWGFFQIINHGVPSELSHKLAEASHKFFHLTMDEKRKVRRDVGKVLGYYDTEHTKNIRDWKEVFDYTVQQPTLAAASVDENDHQVAHWENQWPQSPPEMREVCEEYAKEMVALGMRLMELIAMSMGLKAQRFEEFFKDHTSSVRLNHYPPCPSPELALGVGHHKDPGVLTILAQDDVGGLEVRQKSDGRWVGVKPTPDAYIVNLGDVLQVWSNGEYESVDHRVIVNPEKERYSIPFFLNPSHYTMVEPLPELIRGHQKGAKYRPYNWGKFALSRKHSNFMKLQADNIQIHWFKN
ncbi:hypothetical protein QN277_016459 [Acacia crassicarpa]|uniref:Fe2OG dioxygenase domain-containing protein n=1 Tax=Acacia crassicarpa TaxID=499986 RepID=A0AAE1MWP5_9FABA|nr:hypothetical protein QN277_016459 [Acacia crassicarpa]